jgi:hypothetical protein
VVPVDPSNMSGQDSGVAWSHQHAVFVNKERDGSHTVDASGSMQYYNGSDTAGNWNQWGFTLKPREIPSEQYNIDASAKPSGTAEPSAPADDTQASNEAPKDEQVAATGETSTDAEQPEETQLASAEEPPAEAAGAEEPEDTQLAQAEQPEPEEEPAEDDTMLASTEEVPEEQVA